MLTAALPLPALSRLALRLPKLEWRHWLASLVLAIFLALNLLAGLSLVGVQGQGGQAAAKVPANLPAALRAHVPPAPEPLQFREIAPQDAVAFNASIPLSTSPNPAARPFSLVANSEADRLRAIDCLTSAIYYESAIEPIDGQRAVAQVVLNRARHPAYPNTVCGVVFQGSERSTGCQFTFTCDGSLARTPHPGLWKQAREIAEQALAGKVFAPVGWSTHYHTNWVVPYWSSSLVKAANVGTHIFYRWAGGWGTRPAFRNRYAGVEPDVSKLRHLSTMPPALAVAEEVLTDVAAAAAAAAAAAEAAGAAPAAGDSFNRVVLRRYEPAKPEGVANVLAAQTRSGDAVATSHRWALTGDGAGAKDAPLGKKAEPAKSEAATAAKPTQPAVLEGVRKAGESGGAAT
jgi:spore germination cell wall hydrolase CwlJ-like protein